MLSSAAWRSISRPMDSGQQVVVGTYDTVGEQSLVGANSALGLKGKDIPLGRMGMPQDMADLIRFIVGPGASYITGQTIPLAARS